MRRVRYAREPVQAMSEMDASWPTTSPGARVASTPDRVPVHDALSPGARLDEFEIVRVLGTGGFGIVYLARDHVLLRDVAIKEYMPAALAGRGEGVAVSLRSPGFADTFAGARIVPQRSPAARQLRPPSLVKVHRFWRATHRLHGDALLLRPDAEGGAPAHDLATGRGLARCFSRPCSACSSCCTARACTTATSRPTTSCCSTTAGRSARFRLGAPCHGRQPAVVHGAPQAQLRAARAVRRGVRRMRKARGPTCTRSARRCTSC